MRASIADVLGRMGAESRAAILALGTLLDDSESMVRDAALEALREIGDGALPVWIAALGHKSVDVRYESATALAEFGEKAKAAIPKLKELLNDSDEDVRVAAREALEGIDR